jgi:hypothetical protein
MPIKFYTLVPYHLRDHNIQSWRKSFFCLCPRGKVVFWGPKKATFSSTYGMSLFGFFFLGELGICPQNLMPTWSVEPWENHQFPQGGTLKFTYKGYFFTIKIVYKRFLDWKSKQWKHALVPLLHIEILIFKKHYNINFWWHFKVPQANCLWANLAILGSFGWIWTDFATLKVADNMPKMRLKR